MEKGLMSWFDKLWEEKAQHFIHGYLGQPGPTATPGQLPDHRCRRSLDTLRSQGTGKARDRMLAKRKSKSVLSALRILLPITCLWSPSLTLTLSTETSIRI